MATRKKKVDPEIQNITIEDKEEVAAQEKKPETSKQRVKSSKGIVANCGRLFVRTAPNRTNSGVVTVIPCGTEVTLKSDDLVNDFYYVSIGKYSGYCHKDYIELK